MFEFVGCNTAPCVSHIEEMTGWCNIKEIIDYTIDGVEVWRDK